MIQSYLQKGFGVFLEFEDSSLQNEFLGEYSSIAEAVGIAIRAISWIENNDLYYTDLFRDTYPDAIEDATSFTALKQEEDNIYFMRCTIHFPKNEKYKYAEHDEHIKIVIMEKELFLLRDSLKEELEE